MILTLQYFCICQMIAFHQVTKPRHEYHYCADSPIWLWIGNTFADLVDDAKCSFFLGYTNPPTTVECPTLHHNTICEDTTTLSFLGFWQQKSALMATKLLVGPQI